MLISVFLIDGVLGLAVLDAFRLRITVGSGIIDSFAEGVIFSGTAKYFLHNDHGGTFHGICFQ